MINKRRIALLLGATFLLSLPACASQFNKDVPAPETEEVVSEVTETSVWTADNLNDNERAVLKFLQERGITDKVALATIMGNIKQESRFETRICEGGARVSYSRCLRGGFGLIQWTTPSRYDGLGRHARLKGLDPSTLEAQLAWMVEENQWQRVEHIFKTPGLSRGAYMNAAYKWLGWGVHGSRSHYTALYIKAFYKSDK
jgi:hypothetical protein